MSHLFQKLLLEELIATASATKAETPTTHHDFATGTYARPATKRSIRRQLGKVLNGHLNPPPLPSGNNLANFGSLAVKVEAFIAVPRFTFALFIPGPFKHGHLPLVLPAVCALASSRDLYSGHDAS